MLLWLSASLHLLALGFGLAAIAIRSRLLGQIPDPALLTRLFRADNWWHLALALWLLSGGALLALAPPAHPSPWLYLKLALFLLILLPEWHCCKVLRQWRERQARSRLPAPGDAGLLTLISQWQLLASVLCLFAATAVRLFQIS
ncbi:DUF2214 family protein [uncultured Aquitalea sp.]|uniref:DUF2214 family protein n=1 Tax=uncultured Aquitalea sp. TaxID=540272 RepID=UPI0025D4F133|nr:DUF2214 family protein [uncultured Aquitalea sp.]